MHGLRSARGAAALLPKQEPRRRRSRSGGTPGSRPSQSSRQRGLGRLLLPRNGSAARVREGQFSDSPRGVVEAADLDRRPGWAPAAMECASSCPRRCRWLLGGVVELEQEALELGEALRAEALCPGALDLGDGVAERVDRAGAAWGQGDAFGALVVGIGSALEVVEALELAEQVVEGLFADPQPGG